MVKCGDLILKDGAKAARFIRGVGVGRPFAKHPLILLKKFFLAGRVEVDAAFRLWRKILLGQAAEVEEIEREPVHQRVTKFFQQVQSQAGPAVFNGVIKPR